MKLKLLFLALLTASFAQGQNLIQNGGFEQFTVLTPSSWIVNNGQTLPETSNHSEGNQSLSAYLVSPDPSTLPYFALSQDFTLTDTENYTLKYDYYIPGNSGNNYIERVTHEVTINNAENAFFFPSFPTSSAEYGVWRTVTYEFKVALFKTPATSASIKLTLRSNAQFDTGNVYFDNVSIVKSATLGTQTFDKKSNPVVAVTQSELRLHSDFATSSYVVYAMNGQAVKRGNNSSDSIDISGLAKGVYLLKLNNLESSVKFVK
ncbi:T9SS type A sorting domain-containing protein [Flavobacterium algicola]|uniref:T9SS type A sorting domain-containing protein n=1 Tax=Flavobacterium algicola TaxID=556529 RepID=UPI001EFC5272|nr:T9SS type A sorting domain-containing protein [Flavobacterium algicola]MCG9792021.1 T9SS type A sorting domain-containing protein [Flavobacterium algicola]